MRPHPFDLPGKASRSYYFPREMQLEIHAEAERLERSASWVIQQAWRIACSTIAKLPTPVKADRAA